MPVPARRDPFLVLASGAALALLATVAVVPGAPWRLPLAVVGGLWAPGYAIVALVWRPGALTRLERHALAAGAGLLLAPVVALATSEMIGFGPVQVAAALAVVVLVGTLLARRIEAHEPPVASRMPSTRTTLAASGVALVFAAILVSTSFATAPVLHALALTSTDGSPAPTRWEPGAPPTLRLVAMAGEESIGAPLIVTWDNATLLSRDVRLAPGESTPFDLALPGDAAPGNHTLRATWAGREVHAFVVIGGTPP